MARILLAIEEYKELIFLETLLKKVGFDVVGIQNDLAVYEKLMAFNPDMLVITAQGHRVNGTKTLPKLLQKKANIPPTIFINPKGKALMPADKKAVTVLESPVSPHTMIELIANLLNLNEDVLLDKYEKAEYTAGSDEDIFVHEKESKSPAAKPVNYSTPKATAEKRTSLASFQERLKESEEQKNKRSKKYREIAGRTKLPAYQGFNKALVADQVKDFRQEEKDGLYSDIDRERMEFAKALARQYSATRKR
ncbi:MAG: hypothetical protein AB7F59_05455 [Bdellovibrionales bacterium]